jgi:hypothetical protein
MPDASHTPLTRAELDETLLQASRDSIVRDAMSERCHDRPEAMPDLRRIRVRAQDARRHTQQARPLACAVTRRRR